MDEQTAAGTVEQELTDPAAYWKGRAERAEKALAVERERTGFVLAAVVGASDGQVRFA